MVKLTTALLLFLVASPHCGGESTTEDAAIIREHRARVKSSGKTYFFQFKKESDGNETVYKRVRGGQTTYTVEPELLVETYEAPTSRNGVLDELRKRRNEYMKTERLRLTYGSKLLDDEWSFNFNNQYLEVPDITAQLYEAIDRKFDLLHNVSVVRFLFESYEEDEVIKFDLDTLKDKSETLLDAELHIYRFSDDDDNATSSDIKYSSDLVMRLYQILPVNETEEMITENPDIHKLLNVIYLSSRYSGWQVFKIKSVVENWLNGGDNLGFLLSATNSWENPVLLNIGHKYHGKLQPVLIAYLAKELRREERVTDGIRLTYAPAEKLTRLSVSSNTEPHYTAACGKHIWYISFQELSWNNFIISPPGFMAFRCKGSCTAPGSSFTNHGLLANTFHGTRNHAKVPCCVADSYRPLPIMYYDKNQNVVIKMYDDMIVDSCMCR